MKSTISAIALIAWTVAASASAQSLTLTGPDGQSRVLSTGDLAAMPHVSAPLVSESGPAKTYEGVPLTVLLQSVGAPAGKTLRGKALGLIAVMEASDGYRVALSLAETDAGMRPEKIILADRAGGVALTPPEGPFRLVVEGDLRPTRSARMVVAIKVVAAP